MATKYPLVLNGTTIQELQTGDEITAIASALKSATTNVDVANATAPTTGQVLTATSGTAATWQTPAAGGTSTKPISNISAAYTVVAGDLGKIINCTANTFTVSLTAAATLGAGFTCSIWNSSTTSSHVITIDPSNSETIDGNNTLILGRGEGLDIVCDGTNWQISNKKPMRGYAENYVAGGGNRPTVTGSDSIAIGQASIASGTNSLAMGGYKATAGSSYSTAIGQNSTGTGGSVTATGAGAMALGGSYASGIDSFAAAIANNTSSYGATGANSVAIGQTAKSSGSSATAIGTVVISSGAYALSAGYNNTSSGNYSASIGSFLIASGERSFAAGMQSKAAQYGKYSFSGGQFSVQGDAQFGKLVIRAATTTTTAVVLTSDAAAAGTTNQLILASGQAMTIQGTLIAKQSGSGNMAGWNITGIVSNNGGTMSVSGLALTAIGTDSITLDAAPTIAVDNTNKGVTITSGYKAATNIRWVATVNTSEVTYA